MHWADESSLLLLEFLAREITASPVLILGAYRDMEATGRNPLSQTLGNLVRERHFRRVQLTGLTQQEVGEFVEASKGVAVPRDALETVHSRTEGNPLFVNEVVELIDPGQITENRAWADVIPNGVRDAIGRRLSMLSETCNQVLQTASVIGREFDFALLRGLDSDISAGGVLEALDEALEAKVIEAVPEVAGRYQFGHALIQQSLYEEMALTRRVQAHARIGETLEQMHQTELEEHAAELAHHFAEAEAVTGVEKLVQYSLLAGDRAVKLQSYEEAVAYFQRGLTAKGVDLMGLEAAEENEAAALLSGLGQAQVGTQDRANISRATNSLTRAFGYYENSGNPERAVTTVLFDINPTPPRELIERALKLAPPDSTDAGKLQARYIFSLRFDYDRAQDAFHQARSIALQQQDKALEMQALVAAACVDFTGGHFLQSLERNRQAVHLAQLVDLPIEESHAHYDLEHVLYATGDLEAATRHAEAMLAPAERTHTILWHTRALEANENVCSAKGDWQSARHFIDQILTTSPREATMIGARVVLEYQLGETDAGEVYMERLLETIPGGWSNLPSNLTISNIANCTVPAVVIPVVGHITGENSRFDVAEEIAQSILSSPYAARAFAQAAQIGLALMAVQRGDVMAASESYGSLLPVSGTMSPQSLVGPGLAVDRLLGLLSSTMSEHDQAMTHFEDALTFCRKGGYRPELAWTCHDYADTLLSWDRPGDEQKAKSMMEESLSISAELGMRPLMERVTALQERAETQPVPTPAYPDGLTQREAEVLRLVASGKTDREIGEDLVISVKTVGNHVSNILNKTNVANRTEAAAYAIRRGLVPAYPDGLTQREVEVLRLVATGKTDREIAEELFISVATASTHVRNLLNKTGVANRTEAASYATRRGLSGDDETGGG